MSKEPKYAFSPKWKPLCVKFKRLSAHAKIPVYKTSGAVGMDLSATVYTEILPGDVQLIPLGFAISLPSGYEAQIRPRSGLALNNRITVLNTPGTVDSDYRGEMAVILINLGTEIFKIKRGDRIAQMVLNKVEDQIPIIEVEELDSTERSADGFGSTGKD